MSRPALPGVPEPVRSPVRPIPVLNPLLLAIGGLVYGILLALTLSLWWGLGVFLDVPAPSLSLRTAAILWLIGVGIAVLRDTARKSRMQVAVWPGWIVRSFGEHSKVVPREEITRVRVRTSLVDRIAGTRTIDVFDVEGHRLRLPRVRNPAAIQRALRLHMDAEGAAGETVGSGSDGGADRESQTIGASDQQP